MKKRTKHNWMLAALALMAVMIVLAAIAMSPRGQQWLERQRGGDGQAQVVTDTVATAPAQDEKPDYEFGAPVDDVTAQRIFDDPARDTVPPDSTARKEPVRNQIEQKVHETQTRFDELKRVHAQWQQKPTPALRRRGRQLREQVLVDVVQLMPPARRYHYRYGVELATSVRDEAQAMTFE